MNQPYCGAEWLPHATFPGGSPAPILCDRPLHDRNTMHHNDELDSFWSWQDPEDSP